MRDLALIFGALFLSACVLLGLGLCRAGKTSNIVEMPDRARKAGL